MPGFVTDLGFLPSGFAQVAGGQPVPREPPLSGPQDPGDGLRRYSEFLGHFLSRMGPLAAQPEVQTKHFFLPRAELPQQSGYEPEIHSVRFLVNLIRSLPRFRADWFPPSEKAPYLAENTPKKLPHSVPFSLAFPLLLIHEWSCQEGAFPL